MRRNVPILIAVLSSLVVVLAIMGSAPRQEEFPGFPNIFKGTVTIQQQEAPAGLTLFACVLDCATDWESVAVITTTGGLYSGLQVATPKRLEGKLITFWIEKESRRIKATETDIYDPERDKISITLDLDFPDPLPTPPTPTPTRPPTVTPTPTATPVLPIPGDASVPRLSRLALIAGTAALVVGGAIILLMRRRRAL